MTRLRTSVSPTKHVKPPSLSSCSTVRRRNREGPRLIVAGVAWSWCFIVAATTTPRVAAYTAITAPNRGSAVAKPFVVTSPTFQVLEPSRAASRVRHRTRTSSTSSSSSRLLMTTSPSAQAAPPTPQLEMESVSDSASMTAWRGRLSSDQQRELLRQVGEMRRIQNVQKELAMQTAGLQPPSQSALAEACGYGRSNVAEMNDAVQRGHQAREALVTTNMGLVHHVVQSIVGGKGGSRRGGAQTLARDDLLQEGAIGLARAVDRWNPDIGGKFSTYAYYWIRAGVLRGIAQRDEIVRVPEHMRTVINKLEKAANALGMDNVFADKRWKEAKAAKALAEEAGLTPKQVEQAWQVQDRRRNMVSFEAWMEQGRDVSSMTAEPSATSSADSAPMESAELHDLMSTLGKFLRPRELEALSWRYGLMNDREEAVAASMMQTKKRSPRSYVAEAEQELFGGVSDTPAPDAVPTQGRWGEAMSFVEVGKRMKVSAEYGRRLCHAAIQKLQRAAQEGALMEPAFLF